MAEKENQTKNHTDNNHLNIKIATVILNPTASTNDNYLWTPENSDNAVPGLDSITS